MERQQTATSAARPYRCNSNAAPDARATWSPHARQVRTGQLLARWWLDGGAARVEHPRFTTDWPSLDEHPHTRQGGGPRPGCCAHYRRVTGPATWVVSHFGGNVGFEPHGSVHGTPTAPAIRAWGIGAGHPCLRIGVRFDACAPSAIDWSSTAISAGPSTAS